MSKIGPLFVAAVVLVLLGSPATAEVVAMTSTLSPKNEVPPNDSPATGSAKVDYDTASRMLYWNIEYVGLTAPLSAAHFHGPAATSANARILVPIVLKTQASPLVGSATLTEEQGAEMLAGRWYINLHTPTHPGGELRGQVTRK